MLKMLYNFHKICGISLKSLLRRDMILPRIGLNVLLDHSTVYSSDCNSGCKTGGRIAVKYKPYIPRCPMDHDYKNMNLSRPMSPHLTIYAPTLPAMTSISQRITGALMVFYATLLASAALQENGLDTYLQVIWNLNLTPLKIFFVKFFLGLPFVYHYLIGIRFALWNAGFALDLKTAYKTAYLALALLIPLAGFLAYIDKKLLGITD